MFGKSTSERPCKARWSLAGMKFSLSSAFCSYFCQWWNLSTQILPFRGYAVLVRPYVANHLPCQASCIEAAVCCDTGALYDAPYDRNMAEYSLWTHYRWSVIKSATTLSATSHSRYICDCKLRPEPRCVLQVHSRVRFVRRFRLCIRKNVGTK